MIRDQKGRFVKPTAEVPNTRAEAEASFAKAKGEMVERVVDRHAEAVAAHRQRTADVMLGRRL